MSARQQISLQPSDYDPTLPNSCRILGSGQAPVLCFAQGIAAVLLQTRKLEFRMIDWRGLEKGVYMYLGLYSREVRAARNAPSLVEYMYRTCRVSKDWLWHGLSAQVKPRSTHTFYSNCCLFGNQRPDQRVALMPQTLLDGYVLGTLKSEQYGTCTPLLDGTKPVYTTPLTHAKRTTAVLNTG